MKTTIRIICMCLLLNGILAWTALEYTNNTKAHPGYCYSEEEGVGAMEKGETKTQTGRCVRVHCGEGGLISYAGCGSIGVPPGYILLPQDLSKPYPKCCSKIGPAPRFPKADSNVLDSNTVLLSGFKSI